MFRVCILFSFLSLSYAAHISTGMPEHSICLGATLVYDYKGPIPADKLETGDHVHIISSDITITHDNLKFPQLLHVAIEKCSFKGEIKEFFKTMPSVNRLVLENNQIENFKIPDLRILHELEILNIKNQKMENINAKTFEGFDKLKELHLNLMEIDQIDNRAFDETVNLQILDLSENKLKTISREMLESLKNLKRLMLNNNELTELTEAQFPELPELEVIEIEGNQVSKFNIEKLKKKCPKLRDIKF